MTMMTGKQYRESIRRLKPEVYYLGEKIESVADHVPAEIKKRSEPEPNEACLQPASL